MSLFAKINLHQACWWSYSRQAGGCYSATILVTSILTLNYRVFVSGIGRINSTLVRKLSEIPFPLLLLDEYIPKTEI